MIIKILFHLIKRSNNVTKLTKLLAHILIFLIKEFYVT